MFSWEKLGKAYNTNVEIFLSHNILIERIYIKKEKMEMHFQLQAEEELSVGDTAKCKKILKDCFKQFKVSVEIRIKEKEELTPKEWIIEELYSYLPSSKVWVKDASWEICDNVIVLTPPSEESFFSITQNGFLQRVSTPLKSKWNMELRICKSDECYIPNDEDIENFLHQQASEENELSKSILQEVELSKPKKKVQKNKEGSTSYRWGKKREYPKIKMGDMEMYGLSSSMEGTIFDITHIETKKGFHIVKLSITDGMTSILSKIFFAKSEWYETFEENIQINDYVAVYGVMEYDNFEKMDVFKIDSLEKLEPKVRMDFAEEKRVELHAHTQMSVMDGIISPKDLVKKAKEFGHSALGITDNGVVQAFPDAMSAGSKESLKIIYGLEGNIVQDEKSLVENTEYFKNQNTYVVFDLETTGLSSSYDMITEIGAVKIQEGQVIDSFSQLVNPKRGIPEKIQMLTGITDEMVSNQPDIDEVLPKFCTFIKDSILVAHNAEFDINFIRSQLKRIGKSLENPYLDTLTLARILYPDLTKYNLGTLCKKFGINLLNAHRAVDDSAATGELFLKLMEKAEEDHLKDQILSKNAFPIQTPKKEPAHHVTILAKSQVGLKNLYELVSKSHLEYFYREPKIPFSLLKEKREGLLLGSGCEKGELFQSCLKGKERSELLKIASNFDFLEIQPPSNHKTLLERKFIDSLEDIENINKLIISIGEELKVPVVAVGDVRYLEPEDDIYRKVLVMGSQFKGPRGEEEKNYIKNRVENFYFRTTDEMLKEFSFLGDEKAYEVVVKNTNKIADMIEDFPAIPHGKFPPFIEGAEEDLKNISYENAYKIYGKPLPPLIEERLETELDSIISNGYAVMYIIAHQLVEKSMEDGYYVGSRGSVGSSFVATMSNITEVNPLPPHYICPNCKYSEFSDDLSIGSGVDLPDKKCPNCTTDLLKDGHNIPFEVFLGFHGDKEPDIDLNFAGEYQATAHKYIETLFGEGYVFRAGTIGTLAERTAYGYVLGYFEDMNLPNNKTEMERLVKGCVGVKRTSGQHPGGIMICPKNKDIHDFTPIQYPANDPKSGRITTHFDYHSISENILKLDILGHDTPTIIRMLEDFTGFSSENIKLDDPGTLSLFASFEPLKADTTIFSADTGTLGIPEFGTRFTQDMLMDTKCSTFSELVRISGLSHGTDVWTGNAQELVRQGKATLSEVISTREDIMIYLMNAGAKNKMAFDVMEKVRKGKGIPEEYYEEMLKLPLPEWYIDSCEKIKYMFPKAHAVAYVMMSFRIAYYKLNYPEAFYASYFTQKLADANGALLIQGWQPIKHRLNEIISKGYSVTTKEKNEKTVLEVALEMFARGYQFLDVDIYESDSAKFIPTKEGIRLPLQSLPGLGANVANAIVEEREKGVFLSVEDLKSRTKAGNRVIETLDFHGSINKLPETNQLSLFQL
ncbi:MAG: PolC-type DNA polymerase III [Tissierellia bacterium]|nr:PolC-type DNA polymerase III [Tissierellia bacterium]